MCALRKILPVFTYSRPHGHNLAYLNYRRCVQCSGAHCCNSWCKEEAIFVQLFLALAVSQSIVYLPTLDALATKLNLDRTVFTQLANDFFVGRPEVSRAAEMAVGGLVLPILCYFWLPTYRYVL